MPASSDPRPALIVRSRDGTEATLALGRQPITLGRAAGCDVVLRDDGGVSREHAQVWIDDSGCVLVADLGSKNGTRVDGGELFRAATRPVSRTIRIGEYDIELVGWAPPAPATPTEVRFVADVPTRVGDTRFFPSSKRLDLSQQRLTLLMSLAERIGGAFERKQLLEQAIDACCEALGFERGLIALRTQRGETELPVTRNIQQDETGAYKVSRTLINQALVHGERAVVNNPATDLIDNLSESLVRYPISSALCVPILHREEILGVIYGDRVTQASTYTPEDVDFLAAIAQQVGVGLANLKLVQERLKAEKVYLELERARTIQQRLLPASILTHGRATIAGYNEPSSAVGGDYFDYFPLGDEHAGLIIADVTGHGLSAALIMANLQSAVRVALTREVPLPDVAARLNRLVYANTDSNVFITAIIARIHVHSGALEFISAGHPGPLLLLRETVELFEPENALPLGIHEDDAYPLNTFRLGDRACAALFYTDGLIEAENDAGQMCDLGPIQQALVNVPRCEAQRIVDTTLATVRTYSARKGFDDDLTLLTVVFAPP